MDTAEYMLGDVHVTVALLESDGRIDPETETWTPSQVEQVKEVVREALGWWEDRLREIAPRHHLKFHLDFSLADAPVATGYEPIQRPSNDVRLWINDFLRAVGFDSPADFHSDIRQFNHAQRVRHGRDWAFTILVVHAANDPDGRFDPAGDHAMAFAYPGGQFLVFPYGRTAESVAHETGHIFWAMDEYGGSQPYTARRGYYNAQNLNALEGHPKPQQRVPSIMDHPASAFRAGAVSPSAQAMIGWQDSDGDGIFDVLDVPLLLEGDGALDEATGQFLFHGTAKAQALPNANSWGSGNSITLNRVQRVEYRVDDGPWLTAARADLPIVDLDLRLGPFPSRPTGMALRAVDDRTGITSDVWTWGQLAEMPDETPAAPLEPEPQGESENEGPSEPTANPATDTPNTPHPWDISGDGLLSPLDVMLVMNLLNRHGRLGPGTAADQEETIRRADVSGDGYVSPLDAMLLLNELNLRVRSVSEAAGGQAAGTEVHTTVGQGAEGEPGDCPGTATLDQAFAEFGELSYHERKGPAGIARGVAWWAGSDEPFV